MGEGHRVIQPSVRGVLRILIEAVVLAAALVGAFAIRFDGLVPPDRVTQMLVMLPLVVAIDMTALRLAGVGRQSWQYTTLQDLIEVTKVLVGISILLLLARLVVGGGPGPGVEVLGLPMGVIAADFLLSLGGIAGLRVLRRLQAERREALQPDRQGSAVPRRVLLIGAGRAGVLTAAELVRRPDLGMVPVGFLDDDPDKVGRRVAGLDVIAPVDEVSAVVRSHRVEQVVIAIAALERSAIRRIVDLCEQADVPTKIVPGLYEIVGGNVQVSRVRDVDVADLLGRDQVELDDETTGALITGRTVMVTGAGGSIGSELVRQAARLRPRRLVLIEQAEPALWAIHREVTAAFPGLEVVPLIADVVDHARMARIFDHVTPDVVLHAAAHKHVPMMEANPGEAIKNNVGGTRVVADLATEYDVLRFVLVSTDKAVNPTSIMGATKRLAERYVQHLAISRKLHAVSVRFGNVLDSTGSVVPIFKEQVANGGPVTVTHPKMCRYFMTIPEASQLVLQAAAIGRRGEVLVLDMGEPVMIVDLAEAVIRLSGFEPGTDIPIVFTGLRPGEKLFEELSREDEDATRTRHPKIWIGEVAEDGWTTAETDVRDLLAACDARTKPEIPALVRNLVPEFVYSPAPTVTGPDEPVDPRPAHDLGRAPRGA